MRGVRRALVVVGLLAIACGRNVEAPVTHTRSVCPAARVAVRVLGSGGPIVDDARASTGYLLIVDGRPRLLIDAGGGVALRLGELGVRPESLDAWLISHVHVDHSADLIALRRVSRRERLDSKALRTIESGATFWHLVDLLWIVLFALFYLI